MRRNDTRVVVLVDLDGDGDLDGVAGNHIDDDELYLNDGLGLFVDLSTTNIPATSKRTRSMASGDVDGDGDADLLVGNNSEASDLFLNDGSGFLSVGVGHGLSTESVWASQLVDVDMDGDLDAIQETVLYRNDGAGTFSVDRAAIPGSGDATETAVADLDGDGDPDLLSNSAPGHGLYLNNGSGIFVDQSANVPVPVGTIRALELADVDGDGDRDLLGSTTGSSSSSYVYLNDGAALFEDVSAAQLPQIGEWADSIAAADFDGDGDQDFVLGTTTQDHLYFNDGAGTFSVVTTTGWPIEYDWTFGVALGDVDGDGDSDAVRASVQRNQLYLNDGSGAFSDATGNLPITRDSSYAVVLDDLDGDGDRDLIFGNLGRDALFLNDGAGIFTNRTGALLPDSPSPAPRTYGLTLSDVDGDGSPDLYAVSSNQNRLYLNGGTANFSDVTGSHLPPFGSTVPAASADVDVDGDLDFVQPDTNNVLLLNDGTGIFVDATAGRLPTTGPGALSIALGDVDGDGAPDVFAGNQTQDRLYLNDGSGTFVDVTSSYLPADSNFTLQVDLVDIDEDGDRDVVSVSFSSVYLNDGSGIMSSTPYTGGMQGARCQAIADIDGDQDLDVLVGRIDVDGLLYNLTRHVHWRDTPRLGRDLVMEVHGDPGALWVLLRSLALADTPIVVAPYGELLLQPGPTFVAAAGGVLDGAGQASATFAVPSSLPAGLTGYWQGLVGAPLFFTNVEPTVLQDL